MKTKEEVIKFVQDELECNNTLVFSTTGNGGAGLCEYRTDDAEKIAELVDWLNSYHFEGLAEDNEDLDDIKSSQFYEPEYDVYQFDMSDGGGYSTKMQIMTFEPSF